jgi:hypothetical protein
MTRAKTKPAMHKPGFDAEGILSFAAQGVHSNGHELGPAGGDHDRLSVTLALKPEVIARLKAEAARKEKTLEQIVEKLVSKHLNKH